MLYHVERWHRNSLQPLLCLSVCPYGFCTFADKSLGGNGIKFGMLMYPDDLPLAVIITDGYSFHCMCSSVRPTVHTLGFRYCGQISWKKSLHFGKLMYPDDLITVYLCLWVLLSIRPFVHHIFRVLCICWDIIWKEWHKFWHADVARWLTPIWHRCRWLLLSFHAFVHLSEMVYILACWYTQMTYPIRHRCRWELLSFHAFVRPPVQLYMRLGFGTGMA